MHTKRALSLLLLLAPASVTAVHAQEEGDLVEAGPIEGYHTQPARRAFDASLVDRLRVPEGFRVSVFAEGLEAPRMMAVHDDTVFVTRRDLNDVVALQDSDGDGRADDTETVVEDLPGVHGIAATSASCSA